VNTSIVARADAKTHNWPAPSPNRSRPPDVSKAAGWDFAGRSVVGGTANRQHRSVTQLAALRCSTMLMVICRPVIHVERDKFGRAFQKSG